MPTIHLPRSRRLSFSVRFQVRTGHGTLAPPAGKGYYCITSPLRLRQAQFDEGCRGPVVKLVVRLLEVPDDIHGKLHLEIGRPHDAPLDASLHLNVIWATFLGIVSRLCHMGVGEK